MSGIEEIGAALAAMFAEAGPAATYGGLAAEGGSAAGAAAYGAGAAGAGAASYGGASAAEEAAINAAIAGEAGGGAATSGLLGDGLYLSDPSTGLAADGSGNAFSSDYEKYKEFAKQGFRNVGKAYNKLPPGVSGPVMQGLLGGQQPQQQTNVTPPRMSGPSATPQPSTSLLGTQPLPQVKPYAQTIGGGDDEEMKRRLMLMLRGQGYGTA